MNFLTEGKTNWKYILIVVILAIIVGGGILGYVMYFRKEIISLTKFLEIRKPEKEDPLSRYCRTIFEKTGECPGDKCMVCCGPDQESFGCPMACCAKPCTYFGTEDCSLDSCRIMINCEGKEVCYHKLSGEIPKCGIISYYGQDVPCCEGLIKRCGIVLPDGSCDTTKGGYQDLPWCLPCGNGVCDQFENKCSCPEDCKGVEPETADWKTYQSPDGVFRAQIIPAKKNLLGNAYESRVEIRTKEGKLLQTADYASEDGDHGLIVARAEWSSDSQFFIYSAYSSGGHQPWFSRVYFYKRTDNKIYDFSGASGFTVANDEFIVAAPDIVTFTVYTCIGMGPTATKSFKLSEVISNPPANLLKCE